MHDILREGVNERFVYGQADHKGGVGDNNKYDDIFIKSVFFERVYTL